MQLEVIDMIFSEKKEKAERAIQRAADVYGISKEQCRKDMQEALDASWEAALEDPNLRAAWMMYFPDGEKPDLEDFIIRMVSAI